MSYICEKGRSMVEMLGVLAVVGVLSLGALGGYSKAVGKYKTDRLIEQLSMLAMNIRSTYFDQKDFNNINNTLLINIGAIPADMYDHERATDEIMHIWNGKITIFPSTTSNEKEMAFELYANNISKPVCIELVTRDWGKDPSSGFLSLYIGTLSEDVTEALMNDVRSPSDYNEAGGIYTVGTHNLALPLTVDQAYSACTCSPAGCTLGFKYI